MEDKFNILIRRAKREDSALILHFIQKIAEYEKMTDQVKTTEADIEQNVFDRHQADVILAFYENTPAGFALFFHNFSTFEGRAGLYLEDIFVDKEMRGKGIGSALFNAVAKEAYLRECLRLEWSCLDWNTPSIEFYLHKNAVPMEGWTTYRLTAEHIKSCADQSKFDI